MHSKFTPKKIAGICRNAVMAFGILLTAGSTSAQFYSNGPLSTGATTSNGTAAPAGFTWSEVQTGNTSAGFTANITGFTVADDFTVVGTWNVTKFTFWAYSTGFAGGTSPFNDVRVRIFNTDPSVGNPTPIYGDLTTNRFLSSTSAGMYRIFNAAAGTTRHIWAIEATVNTTLTPGTYWVEWGVGNGGLSNFSPAVTIVGQVTQPGWNAKQHDIAANTWTNLLDGTNPQDMPFRIDYTTGNCTGTPDPGNTITSSASVCPGSPYTVSAQNPTAGSGVTYQWQSAPALTGPYTNIAGATNPTYGTTMSATTFYQLQVTCNGNTGTSVPVEVALAPASSCYCIPPSTNCNLGDIITNVTFGSINNNSTCGTNGYTNYTVTVPATDVIQGATNPMSVTVGNGGTEYVGVWIDYNKSGSFEANEFTLLGSGNGTTITGNVTVPLNAQLGQTRMRVRVRWNTTLGGGDACIGYTYGETEDYTVNIIPCVQGVINTQPVNRTITCSGSTTFSVAATGSNLSYQWEYRTSATAPWQLVTNGGAYSGATTNTLSVSNATAALNGYQYRVIMSGACTAPDFSTVATLTVNNLVATVNNAAPTVCLGAIQQVSITNTTPLSTIAAHSATGLNLLIPDDASTTGVNNAVTVSGIPAGININAIKVRMNITHGWAGDLIVVLKAPNGQILNLLYAFNGTGGAGATTALLNTVISSTSTTPITSGTNPYTGTFRADRFTPATGDPTVPTGPNGFIPTTDSWSALWDPANTTSANGTWTLALYDYYDDLTVTNRFNDWSIEFDYSGGFATGIWGGPAGTIFTDATATTPYDGTTALNSVYVQPTAAGVNNYTVTVNNGPCTTAPLTIPVTANTAVSNLADPVVSATCEGGNAQFTTTADGTGVTYQWQVSDDAGATWTNVTDGGVYAGATTNTLDITGAGDDLNGNLYRVVASVAACSSTATSAGVALTVNPNPVIVLSANPFTEITPGMTTTISAAVSPNAGDVYTWTLNGIALPNATGNTIPVDVDGMGEYVVTVQDVNGCTSTSSAISITDLPSGNVFVYPSPNTGQFQVRYHSAPGNILPRMLNIYDSKGARVYSAQYSLTNPYTRMDVDLSKHGKGIYMIELADRNGNRLKTARVVVL